MADHSNGSNLAFFLSVDIGQEGVGARVFGSQRKRLNVPFPVPDFEFMRLGDKKIEI